jgi:2-polyprenyl-3-methyl-5-hydroxy-6-metoxy-1,4-benzoquinol methylase
MSSQEPIAEPVLEPRERSAYRQRLKHENAQTADIVIQIARKLNPTGGYILVNEAEAKSIFSRVELNGKKVLEVGCGTLPVTVASPPSGRPSIYIASDLSFEIVAEARRLDPQPQYAAFSTLDPAIRDNSIDLIILNQVLHHLPPDADLLGVLRALLTPEGQVVLLEPNVSCGPAELLKWALRRFFGISMEASPYGQFTRPQIRQLIETGGFTVEAEWFASLLAFPLTGGQGRIRILPDHRALFSALVAVDEWFSRWLHSVPWLAAFLHWRVVYLLKPSAAEE